MVVLCSGNWRDYSARGEIALHSLVLHAPERSTLEDSWRIAGGFTSDSLLFVVGESDVSGREGTGARFHRNALLPGVIADV